MHVLNVLNVKPDEAMYLLIVPFSDEIIYVILAC